MNNTTIDNAPTFGSFAGLTERALNQARANGRPWLILYPTRARAILYDAGAAIEARGRGLYAFGFEEWSEEYPSEGTNIGLCWIGSQVDITANEIRETYKISIPDDCVIVFERAPENLPADANYIGTWKHSVAFQLFNDMDRNGPYMAPFDNGPLSAPKADDTAEGHPEPE